MGIRLHVGNLSSVTRENDLANLFNRVGLVMSVSIPIDGRTGNARNFGFVDMGSEEAAKAAIKTFDGSVLRDSSITVREAKPNE